MVSPAGCSNAVMPVDERMSTWGSRFIRLRGPSIRTYGSIVKYTDRSVYLFEYMLVNSDEGAIITGVLEEA
ncbi:hypothetical protein BOCO_0777 [Bombiscardovia coagulans]|uniref:Uncharacterized protein n=1 Tax=Bombiscardovia coagulans TaxID=686666 RepID=A0A261ETS4_9BIFI|nr:hypothetical protein BOCO_0777 [Bombiscardovia coagulans]